MKNRNNITVIFATTLLSALVLVSGCSNSTLTTSTSTPVFTVSKPPTPPTTLPCDTQPAGQVIAVRFTDDGCPIEAYPNNFLIKDTSDFLCWVSADSAGNRAPHRFDLYFDPLVGPSHDSGGNGLVSKRINRSAPLTAEGVEYKYTVVGYNCPSANPDDKYLDPRFWGRR